MRVETKRMLLGRSFLAAWLAFVSAIVCLLIFGPSNFILPSLVITVALLSILRHRIEPVKAVKEEKEEA